jgi:hypothetical protein
MIIVFGFRTPAFTELPAVLYMGNDGDEANRICATDPHPRIERVTNPILHSIKHWDETASAAFEKEHGKKLDEPVVTNVFPHLEPDANVAGSPARAAVTPHELVVNARVAHKKAHRTVENKPGYSLRPAGPAAVESLQQTKRS